MKKHLAGFLIIACLGSFSWAQGNKTDLFDTTKSAQEMEIMKGILGTTLTFVAQNLQRQEAAKSSAKTVSTPYGTVNTTFSWRSTNMNAFYLYGQGAVFVMPASSFRGAGWNLSSRYDFAGAEYFTQAKLAETAALEKGIAAAAAEAARQGAAAGVLAAAAPAPAQAAKPATAPAPAAPVQLKEEELRKRVAEAQERVRKSRADMEANNAKFLAVLDQIKVYLIEAIANHGDSLTTVKPNEYITLVILTDDLESSVFRGELVTRNNQQIISVQKSLITDYKAGRLSLDALKQKVLQYSE